MGEIKPQSAEQSVTELQRVADVLGRQLNAAEEEAAKLRERLDGLEKAATAVSRLGAVTGPQWSKLSMALLYARVALNPIQEG